MDRRTMLRGISAVIAAVAWPANARGKQAPGSEQDRHPGDAGQRLRKIATEEAFTIPEIAEAMRDVVQRGGSSLDLKLLSLIYGAPAESPPTTPQTGTTNRDALARRFLAQLLDLDTARLADMDAKRGCPPPFADGPWRPNVRAGQSGRARAPLERSLERGYTSPPHAL